VLLAGPSGAGKSTLLRALAGVLLTADAGELSGEVLVGGRPPGTRAGQAALLLQDPADATVAATVGRDVAFGPENLALHRPEIWDRVRKSLAAVGFPYGEDHLTGRLSGGEGQRLALAGSLALGPDLVLLDEPTAMLDPAAADEVRRAVLDVVGGATLVVVEHHLEPWLGLVDRIVVLSAAGSIIADGSPADVMTREAENLAAQGVWVPGLPSPDPMPISPDLAGRGVRSGPEPSGEPLLRADELSVAGRLAPVTATFRAGRVTAVRARSGGGKSTLLAALAGLLPPGSGRVAATAALSRGLSADPAGWRSPELAARVGWVAQHPERGFVARTVRMEVLAGAREPSAAHRADALLSAFGLRPGDDPYRLSGGEQRRLALAAALVQAPDLLLFDEPTLGQDRNTWAAVCGALAAARDAGAGIVVATHDDLLVDRLEAAPLELTPAHAVPTPGPHSWPPAARCGPLSAMVVSLLALVASALVRSVAAGVVTVAAILLLAPLAVRSPRDAARRALPGIVAALSIGWSSWLLGGHDGATGVTAGLRIVVLVLPGSLLMAHLDASALGDDLAQRLHLPARPVVAAVAALQRLEDLGRVRAEAAWARRVRGLAAERSPVGRVRETAALTFVLLVQTIRQAARMAVAMDARGFAAAAGRTWAEPSRWRRPDTVLVAIGLIVTALPLLVHVTWT
jgi:energy-coupling factor transport system ATP-binding protein